jgi:hypothetical protein
LRQRESPTNQFPALVARVNADGQVVAEYWNSGHVIAVGYPFVGWFRTTTTGDVYAAFVQRTPDPLGHRDWLAAVDYVLDVDGKVEAAQVLGRLSGGGGLPVGHGAPAGQ